MLHEYHSKKNAVQATQSICFAYRDSVLDARTCQNWFARFRSGKFHLNDQDQSGRPAEADDGKLEKILEEDPRKSTREHAIEHAVSQTTVCNRLKRVGKNSEGWKMGPAQIFGNQYGKSTEYLRFKQKLLNLNYKRVKVKNMRYYLFIFESLLLFYYIIRFNPVLILIKIFL